MEIQEEVEALQSIFMDDVSCAEKEGRLVIMLVSRDSDRILSLRITGEAVQVSILMGEAGHLFVSENTA